MLEITIAVVASAARQLYLTLLMGNCYSFCTKQARPASAAGGLERSQTAPQQPLQPVSALDGDERRVTSSTANTNGSSSSSSGSSSGAQQQQQQLGGAGDILRSASAGPVLGSSKNSATAEEGQEAAVHSLWEDAMQVHLV
jgi:hypothetical protein